MVLISQVSAVLFADDYIYLYEDGQSVTDNNILIKIDDAYPQIYSGGVFIRSQIESTNLSIYITNESDLLDYVDWLDAQPDKSVDYETYIDQYIADQINNSVYNISINITEPEDKETSGNTIGVYRYFNIDIKTGTVDLFDTKKPEDTGFGLLIPFCAIIFIVILMKKKIIKIP